MIARIRATARHVVAHPAFQPAVVTVIVVNAITLGLETSPAVTAVLGRPLGVLDRLALALFVVEIAIRMTAEGRRYWRDPWNLFDFTIVAISLLPTSSAFSVLRALRILRVLRLISVVPSMRRVVSGLLAAVPGMASIAALLALILYVAAVMGTRLFGAVSPEFFGDLGTTLFTLFQTMTGEGWPDIAREIMQEVPLAWIFFVVYILVSSFMVLNLFIAVVVSAMEAEARAEEAEHAQQEQAENRQILTEVRALRAEVAALRTGPVGGA